MLPRARRTNTQYGKLKQRSTGPKSPINSPPLSPSSSQSNLNIHSPSQPSPIRKYQNIAFAISLLLNGVLIYWAVNQYNILSIPSNISSINHIASDIDPVNSNPSYVASLLQSNAQNALKNSKQRSEHRANMGIAKLESVHSDREEVLAKVEMEAANSAENNIGNDRFSHSNQITYSSTDRVHLSTKRAPPYDSMSSIGDQLQQELSWSSPMARTLTGTVVRRASPNLYITESEREIWFNNRFFVFEDHKTAFCVMEKNSCSMFKQIFKRIRGKKDYLSTDYTKIHYLPYRGLEDISFNDVDKLSQIMNDPEFKFAAFVREPLERLVSGYIDKCEKKRGVNLCDYARWSPLYEPKYGPWTGKKGGFTPQFDIWADGLFHCPCWPETDWHMAPQFNFCNLYQYVDRYDIFRFENRTHRQLWMERNGLWEQFGKEGWGSGGNDGKSIVDFGPKAHSSTGSNEDSKFVPRYKVVDPDVLATIIDHFRNDYIYFGIQMADWMCHPDIPINDNVKRALRTLPRTSRPPCDNHPWLWERE